MSSYFAVDDYWYQGSHGIDRRGRYEFQEVWHLLRHPLKTIRSVSDNMPIAWWHWQEKHTRVSRDGNSVRQAARFWLDWTLRCAEQSSAAFRLEDLEEKWPAICERLGIEAKALGDVHAHQRAHPLEPLTWDALRLVDAALCEEVQKLAGRYGYV